MNAGNRGAVDVGEQQGVHASLRAPCHGFVAVAVKRGLVEVGVGVDESHGAKLQRAPPDAVHSVFISISTSFLAPCKPTNYICTPT